MRRTVTKLMLSLPLLLLPALPMLGEPAQPPAGTCATNEQCSEKEFCARLYDSCGESGKCEERPARKKAGAAPTQSGPKRETAPGSPAPALWLLRLSKISRKRGAPPARDSLRRREERPLPREPLSSEKMFYEQF